MRFFTKLPSALKKREGDAGTVSFATGTDATADTESESHTRESTAVFW